MVEQLTLYREITSITEDYLGPAAPRFLNRIIESHLQKSPQEITSEDLPKLITWVQLSISVMTDRENDINRYVSRLQALKH